jgi:hypothetical protein
VETLPTGTSSDLYGQIVNGGWRHVYPNEAAVSLCGEGKVLPVRVTLDPNGGYFAWWDAGMQRFCMVYPKRSQVECCFPFGHEEEEIAGHGQLCQVRVEMRAEGAT